MPKSVINPDIGLGIAGGTGSGKIFSASTGYLPYQYSDGSLWHRRCLGSPVYNSKNLGGEVHEFTSKIKVSLQRFEAANIKQLEYNFAHISRHMIVNLKCVERVQGNQVFMNKGSALYMSRGYAAKFRERYYTYRNRYAL